jgi:hypothetical protein
VRKKRGKILIQYTGKYQELKASSVSESKVTEKYFLQNWLKEFKVRDEWKGGDIHRRGKRSLILNTVLVNSTIFSRPEDKVTVK